MEHQPPQAVESTRTDTFQQPQSAAARDTAVPDQPKQQCSPQGQGAGAWKCLAGLWFIEAFLWGFPLAFGVFQLYYSSHPAFSAGDSVSTIGSLALSIPYLGLPIVNALARRFPNHVRHMLCLGWFGCLASLLAASFATRLWHLLLTQGVLFGVAQTFWFSPSLILINDWFDDRRGLAYGVLFGASGISGLTLPFAMELVCREYGFRWALRGFVFVTLAISGPGLLLVRQRGPIQQPQTCDEKPVPSRGNTVIDLSFVREKWIYPFALAALLQSLAFFLPPTFLPSYAKAIGVSHARCDLLLAINSLAQVSGQITLGYCSDKMHAMVPVTLSTLVSGLAALSLWGLAKTYAPLAVFSFVWGFTSGSYSVLWYRACQHVTRTADGCTALYGFISFARGLSLLVAGPACKWLLGDAMVVERFGLGMYGRMVLFVGLTALLSSVLGLAYVSERKEKRCLSDADV